MVIFIYLVGVVLSGFLFIRFMRYIGTKESSNRDCAAFIVCLLLSWVGALLLGLVLCAELGILNKLLDKLVHGK